MTNASDERATILNAIISNTRTKILFRLGEPKDIDYMVLVFFQGYVDLEEWKIGSARPTAVGSEKVIVRGTSEGEQTAEHDMQSHTRMQAHAHAHGTFTSEGEGSGSGQGSGDMASQLSTPPLTMLGPNADNASMMPVVLSQTSGTNAMRNDFSQTSRSHGTSDVDIDSEGEAFTVARGTTRGRSHTKSENESHITKYESLPTQMYSLTEQLHRLAGEVNNLELRECYVRVGNNRPVRTRTVDLEPTFKSDYFRRVMLPLFHKKAVEQSPYLFPTSEVDAQIAQCLPALQPRSKPEPDFTAPEPMPIVDAPDTFAREFWKGRKLPSADDELPKPKPRKPRGRKPVGDLPPEADRFRIFDGRNDGDGDKQK